MDPGWVITSKKCRHCLNCWFQMGEHKRCFYVFKKDHNQTKQALVRIIACLSFNFLKLTEIAAQLRVLTDTLQKKQNNYFVYFFCRVFTIQVLSSMGSWYVFYFMFVVFFGSFYLINLVLAVVAVSYQQEVVAMQERVREANKHFGNLYGNLTVLLG